ncbi:dirigent protein 1-like [Mercurialis annua]|uniref:dirigent protein 1-like n=1 Tax=Mercurialis annua TaxID=3986 RepID=UPI0024AD3068|nr:dirigent protein 1-like [Mercurialis annua]
MNLFDIGEEEEAERKEDGEENSLSKIFSVLFFCLDMLCVCFGGEVDVRRRVVIREKRKGKCKMSNNFLLFIFTLFIIYLAYTIPKQQYRKQTNLIVYVHDYFTGHDTSAITVAGKDGPTNFNILKFGTLAVVDDLITDGPTIESNAIGRAQGTYMNSQLDGKGLYMIFSLIFSGGGYKGSTLEIQGSDIFSMETREFGVVSGTGYFRFVKGYGVMQTQFMDMPNLRAIIKLNITVKHY